MQLFLRAVHEERSMDRLCLDLGAQRGALCGLVQSRRLWERSALSWALKDRKGLGKSERWRQCQAEDGRRVQKSSKGRG